MQSHFQSAGQQARPAKWARGARSGGARLLTSFSSVAYARADALG